MKKILMTIALLMMFAGCEKEEYLTPDQDSQISIRSEIIDDATTIVVVDERAELINFYNGLESTGTLVWPVDDATSDHCTWDGVYCEEGVIKSLNLENTNISFGSAAINSLNLPNIQRLHLYNNQLTSVPDFNLPSLQYLYLHNNLLTSVPDFSLPNLWYLSLSNNQLTSVPNFNLPSLQYLYLQTNQLTSAPDFNLPNLRYLELHTNQLTSVPDFNLPNLWYLYLYTNQLTSVPNFNLPNLQRLDLHTNQLTSVPDFNLPSLQYLYLYHNQLTSVPNFNLPSLQYLYLQNNQLTSVPDFNLPSLQYLYLYTNQLTCYPSVWRTNFCGSVNVLTFGNPGLPSWDDFCDYGDGACIENPDEQTDELIADLDSYIEEGTVDEEGSKSLYNQLNKALSDLCNGNPEKAIEKLEDFIDLVNDKTPDRIDEEAGAEMIAQAEAIIELIESGDYDLDCP